MTFALPADLAPFVVEKGSVAVDGVSLTVAGRDADRFSVAAHPPHPRRHHPRRPRRRRRRSISRSTCSPSTSTRRSPPAACGARSRRPSDGAEAPAGGRRETSVTAGLRWRRELRGDPARRRSVDAAAGAGPILDSLHAPRLAAAAGAVDRPRRRRPRLRRRRAGRRIDGALPALPAELRSTTSSTCRRCPAALRGRAAGAGPPAPRRGHPGPPPGAARRRSPVESARSGDARRHRRGGRDGGLRPAAGPGRRRRGPPGAGAGGRRRRPGAAAVWPLVARSRRRSADAGERACAAARRGGARRRCSRSACI